MARAVTLTSEYQEDVLAEAKRRYDFHIGNDTPHKYGETDRSLDREIDALGAEPAVAQVLDIPWTPFDNATADRAHGDLDGIEVRYTHYPDGRLWVKPTDKDDWALVLVTGEFPDYVVRGWLPVAEAREVGVIRELQRGRPALWVDQPLLYGSE